MINPSKMTKSSNSDELLGLLFKFGFLFLMIAGAVGFVYYSAVVQQEVYKRQGVEMSVWEVFMGAQPVVRYVVPEEKKGN